MNVNQEFENFKHDLTLLVAASGFEPVPQKGLDKALSQKSSDGVNVRLPPPHQFEYVLYSRGRCTIETVTRRWLRFWRPKVMKDIGYDNVLVLYRLVRKADAVVREGFMVQRQSEYDAGRWHVKLYRVRPCRRGFFLVPAPSLFGLRGPP